MLILIVSGTARGETGRVWLIFLTVPADCRGGGAAAVTSSALGLLTVAQAVYMIALVASLNVMSTGLQPPPRAPRVSTANRVDATFSENAAGIVSADGMERAGRWTISLDLRLNWQGLESDADCPTGLGRCWSRRTARVSRQRSLAAGRRLLPYPTTCWATQAQIGDEVRLPLPANAAAGDWWVSLAAYPGDTADTQPRRSTQPGQAPDQQMGLGPIHVGG